jgi:glycosyltransferase involved in cell wall biosynthesis
MKIVHLSQTDSGAGAGRAAYRIHRGLADNGVDSLLIVGARHKAEEDRVETAGEGWFGRHHARLMAYMEGRLSRRVRRGGGGYFSPAAFGAFEPARDPRVQSADVVCIYWVNGGFIRPEGLRGISMPIVWRLSDVWPFTGGCHYPGQCARFETHCGDCPQLARPSKNDCSRRLWLRKQQAWRDLDMTIAAPSRWIANLAERSSLFRKRRTVVIPTGVDLVLFRPMDRAAARSRLGLPQDRPIILFGALDPAGDVRKGYGELRAALESLACSDGDAAPLAVVFGGKRTGFADRQPLPTVHLGHIEDDSMLAAAYAAADVAVVPSLEDNLPNVALEAIACGTPVVGFDVCGMPEIVRHQWNGYLAKNINGEELAAGIRWVLDDATRLAQLRRNARALAEEHFDLAAQVRRYCDLYTELRAEVLSRASHG